MKYTALAVVAFAAGAELGLTKDQASARRHAITEHPKRKGWYIASGPLQLKAGEDFQFDGDLPKGMAESVEVLQKARQAKADTEAAAAKAQAEALEAATQAVTDAEAALAAAADDAAKAAAQQALDDATAVLQALQA
jgi:membrane protein involved in colicin uptake